MCMCIYACEWWFILTCDYYISIEIWPSQTNNPSSTPVRKMYKESVTTDATKLPKLKYRVCWNFQKTKEKKNLSSWRNKSIHPKDYSQMWIFKVFFFLGGGILPLWHYQFDHVTVIKPKKRVNLTLDSNLQPAFPVLVSNICIFCTSLPSYKFIYLTLKTHLN